MAIYLEFYVKDFSVLMPTRLNSQVINPVSKMPFATSEAPMPTARASHQITISAKNPRLNTHANIANATPVIHDTICIAMEDVSFGSILLMNSTTIGTTSTNDVNVRKLA